RGQGLGERLADREVERRREEGHERDDPRAVRDARREPACGVVRPETEVGHGLLDRLARVVGDSAAAVDDAADGGDSDASAGGDVVDGRSRHDGGRGGRRRASAVEGTRARGRSLLCYHGGSDKKSWRIVLEPPRPWSTRRRRRESGSETVIEFSARIVREPRLAARGAPQYLGARDRDSAGYRAHAGEGGQSGDARDES